MSCVCLVHSYFNILMCMSCDHYNMSWLFKNKTAVSPLFYIFDKEFDMIYIRQEISTITNEMTVLSSDAFLIATERVTQTEWELMVNIS